MNTTYKNKPRRSFPRQKGFSMLEAVVTLVIFMFGLLALLGLQTRALKLNQTAMQRSLASQYAYSMLDTMRSDWRAAQNNRFNTGGLKVSSELTSDDTEAQNVRRVWGRQLAKALPNSRVRICRRTNAISDDLTRDCTEDSGDYFVVRVDWGGAQDSALGIDDGAVDNGQRNALQSIKAVAYIPAI